MPNCYICNSIEVRIENDLFICSACGFEQNLNSTESDWESGQRIPNINQLTAVNPNQLGGARIDANHPDARRNRVLRRLIRAERIAGDGQSKRFLSEILDEVTKLDLSIEIKQRIVRMLHEIIRLHGKGLGWIRHRPQGVMTKEEYELMTRRAFILIAMQKLNEIEVPINVLQYEQEWQVEPIFFNRVKKVLDKALKLAGNGGAAPEKCGIREANERRRQQLLNHLNSLRDLVAKHLGHSTASRVYTQSISLLKQLGEPMDGSDFENLGETCNMKPTKLIPQVIDAAMYILNIPSHDIRQVRRELNLPNRRVPDAMKWLTSADVEEE